MVQSTEPSPLLMAEAPHILDLQDATITPTVFTPAARSFSGCVHDREGRLIKAAQRFTGRDYKPGDPDVLPPTEAAVLEGRSVYLGQLPNHYGHFLLEGLSRVWALSRLPTPDWYVYNRFVLGNPPVFPAFVKIAFEAFGIDFKRVRVIDTPTRCERLHVPTPLFRITDTVRPEFIETFRQISAWCRRDLPAKRVPRACGLSEVGSGRFYFSRRGIPVTARKVANESAVEQIFRSFGFQVLSPETLDFKAQVALYHEAAMLAGFTGSALHNVVFCRPGTRVLELDDPLARKEQNLNQQCCNWISEADSTWLRFQGVKTSIPGQPAVGEFDLEYLREQLGRRIA